MQKQHMTPLTPKGQTVAHKGKGSQMTGMPDRHQVTQLGQPSASINDYAKASPASAPAGMPAPGGFPGV